MKRALLVVALLTGALAGCTDVMQTDHGSGQFVFYLEPDPAATVRAPLEGLGSARTLLTDAALERRTRRFLDHMAGDHFVEVDVLAVVPSDATTLVAPPTSPSPAALRLIPLELTLKTNSAGRVRLQLEYEYGQSAWISNEQVPPPQRPSDCLPDRGPVFVGDRRWPFELALEAFLVRRAVGWIVVYSDRHGAFVEEEVKKGYRLWPK